MKQNFIFGLIGLVIIGAVGFSAMTQAPTDVSGAPIKVGGIAALTGVGVANGEEVRKGAELAVKEINASGGVLGRPIEYIVEDVSIDKLDVAGTVTQKLISIDKVSVIVGPQWDEPAFALLPTAAKAGVAVIGVENTDLPEAVHGDYFYTTWYDNKVGIDELLRFSKTKEVQRAAVIRLFDAGFWKYTSDHFVAHAPEYGITIVDDVTVNDLMTQDFRTHLAKVLMTKPDAIFMVLGDINACAMVRQARELGFTGMVLATESAGTQTVLENCPQVLESLYFSSPVNDTKEYRAFFDAFTNEYGRGPLFPSAVTAYDAVYIAARAIESAGTDEPQKVKEALDRLAPFSGASHALLDFDERGFIKTPDDTFRVFTTRNGRYVEAD